MFGAKKKENAADNMEQFAVAIPFMFPGATKKVLALHVVKLLNEWCYEHDCYPINFHVEDECIFATVRRN